MGQMISGELIEEYYEFVDSLCKSEKVLITEDNKNKLVNEIFNSKVLVSGEDFDLPNGMFFIRRANFTSNDKFKEAITANKKMDFKSIDLYVLVESIEEKVNICLPKKVIFHAVLIKASKKELYKIEIDTRLNSLMIGEKAAVIDLDKADWKDCYDEAKCYTQGRVFVAKLSDLVEIYKDLGEDLFEKNVRFAIQKDANGVDESIKKTLQDDPSMFWFYNNGITLLAENVLCGENNYISIVSKRDNPVSVINGAQTISASAEFFLSKNSQNVDEAIKKAYVLLRIIYVKSPEVINGELREREKLSEQLKNDKLINEIKEIENNISTNLNRQKPIDPSDLAYQTDLVYRINSREKQDEMSLTIIRKGDSKETMETDSYQLYDFARLVLCTVCQMPGTARNAYSKTILKMTGDDFANTIIFPKYKESDFEQIYIKQYGLVNLARILLNIYHKQIKIENIETSETGITYDLWSGKSGEYHFVSFITGMLFCKDGEKQLLEINNRNLIMVKTRLNDKTVEDTLILKYREFLKKVLTTNDQYSTMKSNDRYLEMKKLDEYAAFKREVIKLFSEDESIS